MPETPKSFEERGDGKRNVPSVTTYGLTPQTAAVPASQDAVPDANEHLAYLGMKAEVEALREYLGPRTCYPGTDWTRTLVDEVKAHVRSTQPPQAAVGDGETVPADVFNACMVRMKSLETERDLAIAQRDEAREEISDLQGLLRTNGAALATSIYQKLDLEDRIAALDVPKPESEEKLAEGIRNIARLIVGGDWYGVGQVVDGLLRSLPSEPGSGVQGKAVENAR